MAEPEPTRPLPVDPDAFRATLGRFATGVSVMTTVADGARHGMTANAVSSVSLVPPLVLVCVERDAVMAPLVREAGLFALSFLAADQAALSGWFADAGRPEGDAQFDEVAVTTAVTGAPVLAGGVAWVDCRVSAIHVAGDHDIVVGEVVDLGVGPATEPLVYYGSDYRRLRG